jgi:hypothetical protein
MEPPGEDAFSASACSTCSTRPASPPATRTRMPTAAARRCCRTRTAGRTTPNAPRRASAGLPPARCSSACPHRSSRGHWLVSTFSCSSRASARALPKFRASDMTLPAAVAAQRPLVGVLHLGRDLGVRDAVGCLEADETRVVRLHARAERRLLAPGPRVPARPARGGPFAVRAEAAPSSQGAQATSLQSRQPAPCRRHATPSPPRSRAVCVLEAKAPDHGTGCPHRRATPSTASIGVH